MCRCVSRRSWKLPTSSGYTSTQDNIGKIEGDGIEVDVDLEMFEILPVNVDGLSWNARVNFTKSKAVVTEQADDQIIYGGSTATWLGGNAAALPPSQVAVEPPYII